MDTIEDSGLIAEMEERGEPGVVCYGMHQDQYRAMPGLANSDMKLLRRSPYHFKRRTPKDPTPGMFTGTLAHCALLEPDQFDRRYIVGPEVNKNTKDWKNFVADCEEHDLEPISRAQYDLAHAHARALRAVPEVAELMRSGHPEVSAWWTCPRTGVLCKCRPDWVGIVANGTGCVLLDVKTTEHADPWAFGKTLGDYDYHCQADHYCEGFAIASGLDVFGMLFAVIERDPPHACAVYAVDDEGLARARAANDEARRTYAQCVADDSWPGYPAGVQVITVPRWAA